MSNFWRVVNPALSPPQVAFESGDEQAALREFATRDASAHGLKLLKSEDDGKTWAEVEPRAPSAAAEPTPSTEKQDNPEKDEGKKKASK